MYLCLSTTSSSAFCLRRQLLVPIEMPVSPRPYCVGMIRRLTMLMDNFAVLIAMKSRVNG